MFIGLNVGQLGASCANGAWSAPEGHRLPVPWTFPGIILLSGIMPNMSTCPGNKYYVEDAVLLGLNRYSADMMTQPIMAVALLNLSSRFPSIRVRCIST